MILLSNRVSVGGREIDGMDQLLPDELVLPLALVGGALGLDACWDGSSRTLHLASPVQGRLFVVDVDLGPGADSDIVPALRRVGNGLADLLRAEGATVILKTGDGDHADLGPNDLVDLHLALRAGGDGLVEQRIGARAFWGWADMWSSRAWAASLVKFISLATGIPPRGVRGSLAFWSSDYPDFFRMGNGPAVVIELVDISSRHGTRFMRQGNFQNSCAQGMMDGMKSIFSSYLPRKIPSPDVAPGTVDYASLEEFWAWSKPETTTVEEPGEDDAEAREPDLAAEEAHPQDDADGSVLITAADVLADDQVDSDFPECDGDTRDFQALQGQTVRRKGSVKDITDAVKKRGPSASNLASAITSGRESDSAPPLPDHMRDDLFACIGLSSSRQRSGPSRRRR